MKSVIDWYISKVKNYNSFELSLLEKHRGVTGFLIITSFITVLVVIVYVIYIQFSIDTLIYTLPETSKEETVLIFE
mgnify:CR=1 FL=1